VSTRRLDRSHGATEARAGSGYPPATCGNAADTAGSIALGSPPDTPTPRSPFCGVHPAALPHGATRRGTSEPTRATVSCDRRRKSGHPCQFEVYDQFRRRVSVPRLTAAFLSALGFRSLRRRARYNAHGVCWPRTPTLITFRKRREVDGAALLASHSRALTA